MGFLFPSGSPAPPPPASPAIDASASATPGTQAQNARMAAGLAGAFGDTLLTGPQGAPKPATTGGAKSLVGE